MTDIATLGLAVDSKSVTVASGELDDLSRSAKGAQTSAAGLEAGTDSLSRETRRLSGAAQAAASSERMQTAAMRASTVATNDNIKALRGLGARRQQFIYQSNDVISGLLMGQNPMMVATQQGGQIAQVYGGKGGVANAFEDAAFFAKGLASRLGPFGAIFLGVTAAVGAFAFVMHKSKEEIKEYDDAIDDMAGSIKSAAQANDESKQSFVDLRTEYGGNESAVRDYISALVDLREIQKMDALDDTLKSIGNVDAVKSIRSALEADIGISGSGRLLAIQSMTKEMGVSENAARELIARVDELGQVSSFEEAAEKAADLRRFLSETDSELSDELLPTILEFEGVARTAFSSASEGAKEIESAAKKAASAMDKIYGIREKASQKAMSVAGNEIGLIQLRLEEDKSALKESSRAAVKAGESKLTVAREAFNTLSQLEKTAAAEIRKVQEKDLSERKKKSEAEASARMRSMDALKTKSESIAQSALKSEGRAIELIQRRLQNEYAALDELAAKAIANGADETQVNEQVARAKRDAMFNANQEIHDHNKALLEKEAAETVRLAKEAARQKAEEERLNSQIGKFGSRLASQGVFGAPDISASPFAYQAGALGQGAVEGVGGVMQQEQERLDQLQAFEDKKRSILGENQAAILAMEAEFEATRNAIKADSLVQQQVVINESQRDLAANIESELGTLTNAMGSILGEQSEAYKTFLIAQKGAALAQAAIALPTAIAEAMKLPFPLNFVQAAASAATVAAQIASIKNVAIGGRQFGGATSAGTPYEINEDGKPEIYQQGNKKYLLSGSGGNVTPEPRMQEAANDRASGRMPKVTVNNFGGSQVQVKQISRDEIAVMIDEQARSIVKQEAPEVMSAQIAIPNSQFSSAITSNTLTARRRP